MQHMVNLNISVLWPTCWYLTTTPIISGLLPIYGSSANNQCDVLSICNRYSFQWGIRGCFCCVQVSDLWDPCWASAPHCWTSSCGWVQCYHRLDRSDRCYCHEHPHTRGDGCCFNSYRLCDFAERGRFVATANSGWATILVSGADMPDHSESEESRQYFDHASRTVPRTTPPSGRGPCRIILDHFLPRRPRLPRWTWSEPAPRNAGIKCGQHFHSTGPDFHPDSELANFPKKLVRPLCKVEMRYFFSCYITNSFLASGWIFLMLTLWGGYFTTYLAHLVPPISAKCFPQRGRGGYTPIPPKKNRYFWSKTHFLTF